MQSFIGSSVFTNSCAHNPSSKPWIYFCEGCCSSADELTRMQCSLSCLFIRLCQCAIRSIMIDRELLLLQRSYHKWKYGKSMEIIMKSLLTTKVWCMYSRILNLFEILLISPGLLLAVCACVRGLCHTGLLIPQFCPFGRALCSPKRAILWNHVVPYDNEGLVEVGYWIFSKSYSLSVTTTFIKDLSQRNSKASSKLKTQSAHTDTIKGML